MAMKHNLCKTCGASDGRAGFLINGECQNCYETRRYSEVHVHMHLPRTEDEIKKTMAILDDAPVV